MDDKRLVQLQTYIEDYLKEGVMVADSGGVDSAFLLYMACKTAGQYGFPKVYAVTVKTKLQPSGELYVAQGLAEEFGAIYKVIEMDELREIPIADNPRNRCYLCKKSFFEKILVLADSFGIQHVLDGTNADDLKQYRPGIQALLELGIVSPLAECGLTKEEIRKYATQFGISVADRPSSPCLATRLPYGSHISYDLLKRIAEGEFFLRKLGFYNVRLRVHNDIARIEVDNDAIPMVIQQREKIITALKRLGFCYITMDLEGFRSGSMDE